VARTPDPIVQLHRIHLPPSARSPRAQDADFYSATVRSPDRFRCPFCLRDSQAQLSRIPQKSQLAEDIRYTLAHWPGLIRFLDDGTLELDTNPVENQIRPIALTRKNALFAGNETGAETWAMLASLVATCKLAGVNPVDYLADTLRAILDGHPKSRTEDLMPWRHAQPSSLAA